MRWKCPNCGEEYNLEDIYIDEKGNVQDCLKCGCNLLLVKEKNDNKNN